MVERRTRRQFMNESKAQAVKRLLEGGRRLLTVATKFGIGSGQLSMWRRAHLAAGFRRAVGLASR